MNESSKQNDKTFDSEAVNHEALTNNISSNEILNNQVPNHQQLDKQAKQIASMLDEQSKRLSMRTIKLLENARERAVKAHGHSSGLNINSDGTLSQTIGWAEHHRLATAGMVLVAITAGFLLMQSMSKSEYSDAFLLGSDLPPEAFVDKGFAPSLNFKQAKI